MIRRAYRWEDLPSAKLTPAATSFAQIKTWRDIEILAGRPSGLLDYYRAHGLCIACQASGKRSTPVDWEGEVPLFEPCEVCAGTGKVTLN